MLFTDGIIFLCDVDKSDPYFKLDFDKWRSLISRVGSGGIYLEQSLQWEWFKRAKGLRAALHAAQKQMPSEINVFKYVFCGISALLALFRGALVVGSLFTAVTEGGM